MLMNWHSEPVLMMLPNISIGLYNLHGSFTDAVSCSSYNQFVESVSLIFSFYRSRGYGSQRNVHSYTAHEVVDLKCAREDCIWLQ